jgi:hypothetical protein
MTITFFVFLDVETTKQHDGFGSVDTAIDLVRRLDTRTRFQDQSLFLPRRRWEEIYIA